MKRQQYIKILVSAAIPLTLGSCVSMGEFFDKVNNIMGEVADSGGYDNYANSGQQYDTSGYPIFGYQNSQPVYGYTTGGAPITNVINITSNSYVPNWGNQPRGSRGHRVDTPPKFVKDQYRRFDKPRGRDRDKHRARQDRGRDHRDSRNDNAFSHRDNRGDHKGRDFGSSGGYHSRNDARTMPNDRNKANDRRHNRHSTAEPTPPQPTPPQTKDRRSKGLEDNGGRGNGRGTMPRRTEFNDISGNGQGTM